MRTFRVLLLVMIAAVLSSLATPTVSVAAEKVTLALEFLPYGTHVPVFAAKSKGFFSDAGIDADIVRGFGSADSTKRIGTGTAEFAITSAVQLIRGRARGMKIKELYMIHHVGPDTIYYLKSSGISSPKDLSGKSLGFIPGGGLDKSFEAFATKNGLEMAKIKMVGVDPAQMFAGLAKRRVDSFITYHTLTPVFNAVAAQANESIGLMRFPQYGIDVYSNGFATQEKLIDEKPELVANFVRAVAKGVWWSMNNVEAGIDEFLKQNQAAKRPIVLQQFIITFDDLLWDGLAEKQGVGFMDRAKMERTIKFCEDYLEVPKGSIKPEDVYTNKFNEQLPKEWRFLKKLAKN